MNKEIIEFYLNFIMFPYDTLIEQLSSHNELKSDSKEIVTLESMFNQLEEYEKVVSEDEISLYDSFRQRALRIYNYLLPLRKNEYILDSNIANSQVYSHMKSFQKKPALYRRFEDGILRIVNERDVDCYNYELKMQEKLKIKTLLLGWREDAKIELDAMNNGEKYIAVLDEAECKERETDYKEWLNEVNSGIFTSSSREYKEMKKCLEKVISENASLLDSDEDNNMKSRLDKIGAFKDSIDELGIKAKAYIDHKLTNETELKGAARRRFNIANHIYAQARYGSTRLGRIYLKVLNGGK